MPEAAPAPPTRTRAVFGRIRGDILAGSYGPGARLSPRALATETNVSMSVVREALTRLAGQGLVLAEPQLGFSVVKLDMDDVRDISAMRILVEGEALRQAILHADVEYEARVLASHHRLSRTPMHGEARESVAADLWAEQHALFHAALISAAPSARLRQLAATLRETAELYRRWSGMARGEHGVRDVPAEHQALMQAALDRDGERAVVLLSDHINTTTVLLEAYIEQHRPDLVP